MCNLYSMTRAPDAVLHLFRVGHNRASSFQPQDAIFPAHQAPVVRLGDDGERELATMSWGFVLPQKDRAPRRVTNFRDDRTLQSPFWRDSFKTRRCLVPASSFAEPAEVTPATWHWFALRPDKPMTPSSPRPPRSPATQPSQDDDRPLFAFAGIWRTWKGPVRKAGPDVEIDVYAFMTTTPNALVATINHERMPVLLTSPADHQTWLTGAPEQAFALARETPAEEMRIVQAGFEKRDLLAVHEPAPQWRQGRLI